MKYIRSLDGVRAIALLLVLISHWIPSTAWVNQWNLGDFGVNIFFVLSGFLITSILLEGRNANDGNVRVILHFYMRRILRIFPIYYLTILFIYLFNNRMNVPMETGELLSAATYTINFFFYNHKFWGILTVHFWSLAVEEQFYLIWPFIIIMLPKKMLVPVIMGFILVSVFFQMQIEEIEYSYLPTYTCFDSFGIGAIMAWIKYYKQRILPNYIWIPASLIICALLLLFVHEYTQYFTYFPIRTMQSLIAVSLIWFLIIENEKKHGVVYSFFANGFLVFIGRISYGMYMYHVLVQWFSMALRQKLQKVTGYSFFLDKPVLFFLFEFILLVAISYLSWKWIERPILNLKKYFPSKAGYTK